MEIGKEPGAKATVQSHVDCVLLNLKGHHFHSDISCCTGPGSDLISKGRGVKEREGSFELCELELSQISPAIKLFP